MRLVAILLVSLMVLPVAAPLRGQQDKRNDRLQELLKRFPDADVNKDGTLSREEALAYRRQRDNQKADAKQAAPKKANQRKIADSPQPPTHADVKYGPAERNVLDFYQASSDKPTPLVINIHGGGFVAGDKRGSLNAQSLRQMLDAGISVASINYRFVDGQETIFPAPQHDGARAVQFLRSKASAWNIDPKRVACMGGSAGAGISMWIGFHDELAKPDSSDPVQRESTRIVAIGTFGGQGTYDPIQIKELIGGRAWEHPSIFKVYGITTTEEALHPTPERKRLYDEASAIAHLTKDDPPLFMVYNEADGPLPADARPGQGIHHPNFGRQLKKKMDDLGIENVLVYVPDAPARDIGGEMLKFFERQFARVK